MNKERTKVLYEPEDIKQGDVGGNCVYYWMQRDVRAVDNWALLFAQHLAQMQNIPLRVVYVLPCPFRMDDDDNKNDDDELPPKVCEMQMTQRHGSFLLGGLKVVEQELMEKNVPFHILMSKSHSDVGQTVHDFIMGKAKTKVDGTNSSKGKGGGQIASVLVCDMNPLRQYRNWVEDQVTPLMRDCGVPFYQVDAQ